MDIFKIRKKKDTPVVTSAPEEPETPAEQNYMDQVSENKVVETTTPTQVTSPTPVTAQAPAPAPNPEDTKIEKEKRKAIEIPICMSQEQINNLVIENNIILKQIISEIDN